MNGTRNRTQLRAKALAVGGAAVLVAGIAGTALAQDESAAPLPWTPEKTELTLGYRLPSLNSVAPLLVAQDKGFWQECGLDKVDYVQTEQVMPGVVAGSLDVGIVETNDAGQAEVDGLPVKIISAYRPWSVNTIAVSPDIKTPADLAGKDIILGGTPGTLDFDFRVDLLKKAGYDLTGVDFNAITVPGGSDAWVALLEAGKIAMTPAFNRHHDRLKDEGFQFWVDEFDFGNQHVVGNADFLANDPDAAAAFDCGLIKGIQVWSDPANEDYILGLGEASGIEITDGIKAAYTQDIKQYQPGDGGWPMDDMVKYLEELVTPDVPGDVNLDNLLDLEPLHRAQEYLGLPLDPPMAADGAMASASPDAG